MLRSFRIFLAIGAALAAPIGQAAANCPLLDRVDALNRIGQALVETPSEQNRAALRDEIAEVSRSGIALGSLESSRQSLSTSIDFYLAALNLLAEETDREPAALWSRVEATAEGLRRRAEALGCGKEAPEAEVVAAEATGEGEAGEGGGEGAGGRRKADPTGLVVLGVGAMTIPALLLPSILVLFRKHKVRRTKREPVRYVTTIQFGENDYACMIIDASRGGLRITTPERLPRAGTARITLPDRAVNVAVRWRTEYEMGLEFETHLDDEALTRLSLW